MVRIAYAAPLLSAALLSAAPAWAQEARSPLPGIAAPAPNVGASSIRAEPPIVERPPARLRSGPPRIACWACRSNTPAYAGSYIGGGNPFCFGRPRMATEGTWGWDYRGCWLRQRVFLNWWRGGCRQGGAGAYRIDGPPIIKLIEDLGQKATPRP